MRAGGGTPAGLAAAVPRRPRPSRRLWLTATLGGCFIAIDWGLRDAPVLWFAALRALVAGGALLLLAAVQRRPFPVGVRAWGRITILGLVNVTLAFGAMFAAAAGLATGTAAVLANAQPLLILLPAWWLYGEKLSTRTTVALVVGFAGLLVVALPGGGGNGAVLSLLAAAAVTGGTLLARRLGDLDVVAATGWHLVIGGLALAGLAGAVQGAPVIAWTPRFLLSLAFLALLGTAATTRVPRPGSESSVRVPPSSSIRSRMECRPNPSRVNGTLATSNPWPSSSITNVVSRPSSRTRTTALDAPECLRTLVRASWTTRRSCTW